MAPRTEPKRAESARADAPQKFDLVFDNNRLASALYGEFDQNLALIERRLGVDARARGNMVTLRRPVAAAGARAASAGIALRPAARGPRRAAGRRRGRDPHGGGGGGAAAAPDARRDPAACSLARIATRKKSVVARTPMQDAYIRAMDRCELVFGIGPAGTGKTYLAVAFAAAMLERGDVERIILSRPAVEAGERLGFLPGDMKEKVDPYLRPLYDALYDMMPARQGGARARLRHHRGGAARLHARPDARARRDHSGRGARTRRTMQMKMFLTRLGEDSKMIVTGDPTQSDLKPGELSGLQRGDADSGRRGECSVICVYRARTWCAIRWCRGSWRLTSGMSGARPTRQAEGVSTDGRKPNHGPDRRTGRARPLSGSRYRP